MISDSTFIAEDYFDADHLSEIGAKKLSLKINKILLKNDFNNQIKSISKK